MCEKNTSCKTSCNQNILKRGYKIQPVPAFLPSVLLFVGLHFFWQNSSLLCFLSNLTDMFLMLEAELALLKYESCNSLSYFPMHQKSSNLEFCGPRNEPLTGQNLVSPFDHEHALLYFNFLTRKTIELDIDVSYQMYIYLLTSKCIRITSI